MIAPWPGAVAALKLPDQLTYLRYDRSSYEILGVVPVERTAEVGYEDVLPSDIFFRQSYSHYRAPSEGLVRVPAGVNKLHVEFTVSSESQFHGEDLWRYPNSDFSHNGYWQTPGEPGEDGDPLRGAIEVSWDGTPRIRYRRDKGEWMVADLAEMQGSWVWEDFTPSDGEWRNLKFLTGPVNNPATQYPTMASYATVSDIPPGEPYPTEGWALDNIYVFLDSPVPQPPEEPASFWTNFRNCREVDE